MKRRVVLGVAIGAALLLGGLFGRLWAQQKSQTFAESLQMFSRVIGLVMGGYVEEVDNNQLVREAIRGMLGSLDPYSEFLDETDYKELRVRTEGQFGGIGIHIGIVDERLTVISPIEGTPAERAGIIGGDRIAEIDGKSTQGFSTADAVKLLRGEPGTKVSLGIERPGATEVLRFELTRAVINIRAVPYAGMVASEIGYVRLADFSRAATSDLKRAVDSLIGLGARKLVLDLRQNGGGLLREGSEVSDLFLPSGRLIVRTAGRIPDSRNEFRAETEEQCSDFPLAVLVDRGSASATEIVAGALQDWERGVLIGETTFGKGSVQTITPLSADYGVKITTAYWYTPSGRCINRKRDRNGDVAQDTSSGVSRQQYRTLGALRRPLYGAGGIAPDVYVPYQRLTGLAARVTRDAYFDFAVLYNHTHKGLDLDFEAGDEVLAQFADYLRENKKMSFSVAEFDSAREFIAGSIETEVGAKLQGTRGEYRMRLRRDSQVRKAVELLTGARSTEQLLRALH